MAACLEAVARQTEMPDEVIVVDNNCTDDTANIARSFDFVTLLKERVQGKGSARDRGFNAAKSDILARIDADSEIDPGWVATLRRSFDDPEVVGVTGPGRSLLLPRVPRPMTLLWSRLYFLWTEMFFRVPVLWGANMAVRSDAWAKIRHKVCLNDNLVHEDQDISLLLQAHTGKLSYNPQLQFTSYSQAYHYFPKLLAYTIMRHTGRDYHRSIGTLRKLNYTMSRPQSLFLYAVGWPIIFIFFAMSFVAWPIDLTMKVLGRQRDWLS